MEGLEGFDPVKKPSLERKKSIDVNNVYEKPFQPFHIFEILFNIIGLCPGCSGRNPSTGTGWCPLTGPRHSNNGLNGGN